MKQVKSFTSPSNKLLDKKINNWIKKNNEYDILNIQFQYEGTCAAMITYTKKQ